MDELWETLREVFTFWQPGHLPQLGYWSYALLALLVAVEGPVATLLAATAAARGWFNPVLVFVASTMGNMVADIAWYLLGYFGPVDRLLRYGRWLKLRQEHLDRLTQDMHVNAPRVLFITKLTSSLVIPALVAAGLARVPWRRWIGMFIAAEFIWTGSLVALGYYLGEFTRQLEWGLQLLAVAGTVAVILLLTGYFLRRRS